MQVLEEDHERAHERAPIGQRLKEEPPGGERLKLTLARGHALGDKADERAEVPFNPFRFSFVSEKKLNITMFVMSTTP